MDKAWTVRFRRTDGWPPTYHHRLTREEVIELVTTNFAVEQDLLFDVTITRGDFGGELDRARGNSWPAPAADHRACLAKEVQLLQRLAQANDDHLVTLREIHTLLAAIRALGKPVEPPAEKD